MTEEAEKQICIISRPFLRTSWDHCQKCTIWDSFQEPSQKTQVKVYFQDHLPKMDHIWLLSRPQGHKVSKWWVFSRLWRMDSKSWLLSRPLKKRVKRLNLSYMVPVNEISWVISDPQTAKMAQPVKDQPLSGPPPKGLRFNPIYVEPGLTSINNTRDLQALFPNSFDCIGDMSGEYDIKTDPTVHPIQHRRQKVPIEYKEEIEKELVHQGIIMKQTEPTPSVSSHVPQEGKWQVEDMSQSKGLE